MLILIITAKLACYADYRYYTWTYQYMTMLPGRTKIELYTQIDQSDIFNSNTVKWKRQIE